MERVTLTNRPATLPPRTRIEDFQVGDTYVRVSLKLVEAGADKMLIDAQGYEVDSQGSYVTGPDGRPSRTQGTAHMVMPSSLGDTHTLNPGWVRIVGDYDETTFEPTAPRSTGKPADAPDLEVNPTGQHFDTSAGVGYRWDEGEVLRIARGKVDELMNIKRNSAPIAGLDF